MDESENSKKGGEVICKKDTGTEANASPTLGFPECLDATKHAQNLMDLREKRVETTEIPNEANTARKAGTDDGNCEAQDVDAEYSMNIKPAEIGKKASTPVVDE
jgi:hypothetical protein